MTICEFLGKKTAYIDSLARTSQLHKLCKNCNFCVISCLVEFYNLWERIMNRKNAYGEQSAIYEGHRFYKLSKMIVVSLLLSLSNGSAIAQANTCGNAVAQLQNYVVQVNSFANQEYYQGIPMRCGGNPNCAQWWLGQLNG